MAEKQVGPPEGQRAVRSAQFGLGGSEKPNNNRQSAESLDSPPKKPARDEGRNRRYSDEYRKRVRSSKPTKALLALAFKGQMP